MPARLHAGRAPPAAPSAARLLTTRHAQQPPAHHQQHHHHQAAPGGPALVNRCTSLTTASERSYGSSLLSAAFERHDNRR